MMAFNYPISVDEIITVRDGDYEIMNDGTLMIYPTIDGNGLITLELHSPYGQITTSIVEDDEIDMWRIFTFSTQKVFGKVTVREKEYTSHGGHNPVWLLQSHTIDGVAQPIIYNV